MIKRFIKRFTFEFKIVSIILLVLLIVVTTGIITYSNFTSIIYNVTEVAKPDEKMVLLEELRANLSNAESSVKSYNLSRDETYLAPFYNSISVIEVLMNKVKKLSATDSIQNRLTDSLETLVNEKYDVLSEILMLQNNEKVTDELRRISEQLDRAMAIKMQKVEVQQAPEKKKGLLSRIFGKKKKKEEEAKAKTTTKYVMPDAVPLLNNVKKQVGRRIVAVKKEQIRQLKDIKMKELDLLKHDKNIMDNIRSLILDLQNEVKKHIDEQTAQTSALADKANHLIALFCVAASILLLIVSYVILGYVRKNNAYSAALSHAKSEAENLAKAKEMFLANMSHEIRTPMNAIAGFTEQLLQTELNETQQNQLEIVNKSSYHLLKILNDVLDYSKIQSGKFAFDKELFKPQVLLEEIIAVMKQQAQEKGIGLLLNVHKNVPPAFVGDPVRLRQILFNIIGNAIKFTSKGEVTVSATVLLQNSREATLQIIVKDTGVGISSENIRKIFNEFEQADSSIAGKYGGTGLGLSITRKLVELQKGKLELTSQAGEGTSVMFQIPYTVASGKVQPKEKETPKPAFASASLKNKRILIADDEDYNLRLLETILEKWDARITVVKNGKEALNEFMQNEYDLLLLDIRMPEMSGLDVCTHIRKLDDPDKAKVPIIALTAVGSTEELNRYKKGGFNECISKPFPEIELYNKVCALLNISNEQTAPQTHSNNGHSKKHFDVSELQSLSNGDPRFFEDMIKLFVTSTRESMKVMTEACAKENWALVADCAHKIIPACGHLHVLVLIDLLKKVENDIRNHNDTSKIKQLVEKANKEANTVFAEMEKMIGINV